MIDKKENCGFLIIFIFFHCFHSFYIKKTKQELEKGKQQETEISYMEKQVSQALEEVKELCRLHSSLSREESELEQEKYRLSAVSDGKSDFEGVKNEKNKLLVF